MGVGCERGAEKQRSRLAAGGGVTWDGLGLAAEAAKGRGSGRRSVIWVFEMTFGDEGDFPPFAVGCGVVGERRVLGWVTRHLSEGSSTGRGHRSAGGRLTLHVWPWTSVTKQTYSAAPGGPAGEAGRH